MSTESSLETLPEGEEFAICVYMMQSYAKLSFMEAYVYLWTEQFRRPAHVFGKSRQAIYSLKKKAERKIEECDVPILDMIRPYVESAPFLWVD
jgi:hypothetical protein